jgi:hypothetical protein
VTSRMQLRSGAGGQEIVSKDVLQGVSAVSRMIIIADDEWRTVTELPF